MKTLANITYCQRLDYGKFSEKGRLGGPPFVQGVLLASVETTGKSAVAAEPEFHQKGSSFPAVLPAHVDNWRIFKNGRKSALTPRKATAYPSHHVEGLATGRSATAFPFDGPCGWLFRSLRRSQEVGHTDVSWPLES